MGKIIEVGTNVVIAVTCLKIFPIILNIYLFLNPESTWKRPFYFFFFSYLSAVVQIMARRSSCICFAYFYSDLLYAVLFY